MNQEEVFKIISDYLSTEFEISTKKIKLGSNLFTDLEMDSIDALDLASKMQSELKVTTNKEELKQIRTVQDVVNYIIRNRRN